MIHQTIKFCNIKSIQIVVIYASMLCSLFLKSSPLYSKQITKSVISNEISLIGSPMRRGYC